LREDEDRRRLDARGDTPLPPPPAPASSSDSCASRLASFLISFAATTFGSMSLLTVSDLRMRGVVLPLVLAAAIGGGFGRPNTYTVPVLSVGWNLYPSRSNSLSCSGVLTLLTAQYRVMSPRACLAKKERTRPLSLKTQSIHSVPSGSLDRSTTLEYSCDATFTTNRGGPRPLPAANGAKRAVSTLCCCQRSYRCFTGAPPMLGIGSFVPIHSRYGWIMSNGRTQPYLQ
jgi:hypothetical protein